MWFRKRSDQDFSEEIEVHIEIEADRLVATGMPRADARSAAMRAFGNRTKAQEQFHEANTWTYLEQVLQDLRYAARTLSRTPAFVGVSIFTLGIAIAIGTMAFTAVNAFIYRPLPVPDAGRLLAVFTSDFSGHEKHGGSSYADIADFASEADPIADLAGESRITLGVGEGDDASLLQGALVSSRYFRVLRIKAALGQFPSTLAATVPSIVLSHGFWRRAFASDSAIIGRPVRVNGQPFIVAAIAPPEFRGTSRESAIEFWIDAAFSPLVLLRDDLLRRRGDRSFHMIGRLRDDASIETLNARLSLVSARLSQVYPREWRDTTGSARVVTALREQDVIASSVPRAELLLLVGGVIAFGFGLVAIACTNLASMQMAHGAARRREIATRLALGAGRGRLIRQLLAECALIAVPGFVAGVALAIGVSAAVSRYLPLAIPSLDLAMDWRALAFIVGALALTLLVFGLMPALQSVRADVLTDLKGGEQPGAGGLRVGGVRGGLIVAQLALSMVFTASAGLVAFALIRQSNQGRDEAQKVLITRVNFLPAAGEATQVETIVSDVLSGIEAMPGVESASAAAFIPVRGTRMSVIAETRSATGEMRKRELDANFTRPGYFRVVGIPQLRGRDFEPADFGANYRVAIVSKGMAEALWPGEEAIGKQLFVDEQRTPVEVIGVVADPAGFVPATDRSYPGLVYLPLRSGREARVIFHIRAATGQGAIATRIGELFHRYGARLVAPRAMALDEYRDQVAMPQRIIARASGAIAAVQLVLAIAGLSGLVAYVTTLRQREIGIRTALGASRRSVLALVMKQGIRLTAIGGTIGLALSVVVARVVADVVTVTPSVAIGGLMLAAAIFALVGTVAMLLPARRALELAPAAALRVD